MCDSHQPLNGADSEPDIDTLIGAAFRAGQRRGARKVAEATQEVVDHLKRRIPERGSLDEIGFGFDSEREAITKLESVIQELVQ